MKHKRRNAVLAAALAASLVTAVPYFSEAAPAVSSEEASVNAEPAVQEEAASPAAGDVKTAAAEPAAQAEPAAASKPVTAKPKLNPITATEKMAERGNYTLYADKKSGNIRIVSKSGKEWLGSPQSDRKTTSTNKKYMDSPVHIKYTEGAEVTATYPLKEKGTLIKVTPVEQGFRVDYDVVTIKMKLAVEYRLTDDGIEVTIPENSIVESGTARLVSLEALPFLNAAKGSEDGAILLPDGSGALIRFKEKHAPYFAGYSQPIYGFDWNFKTQYNDYMDVSFQHRTSPKEKIAMPVFGIHRNGAGVLGIVTEGQFSANINATPSGIRNIPYYHVSTEFIYRNDDVIFIGNTGRVPLFQGKRISGDRKIRYLLLEDEAANYVGMAKAYRSYLMNAEGVKPVQSDGAPLNLRLFGGVERDEVFGTTYISMTTFDQARTIVDVYVARGITRLDLTLTGWNDDGQYGDQPDHFPVASQLGGKKELKALVDYARSKGIRLFLNANYVRVASESDGISKRKDSIHGIDREVLKTYESFVASGWGDPSRVFYLMKPQRMLDNHITKELQTYADLGVAGVSFAGIGDMLYSDQDKNKLTERQETAGIWHKALETYRSKLGATAVDYGFAYTFGEVDRIDGAPMDSSHFIFADETVPFYQLVTHGLVPYSAPASNLRDDSQVEALRAIEFGAIPSYELTFEETSKLQRTMEDRLFSSHYTDWIDASQAEYEDYRKVADSTINEQMINHEKISNDVYRTTYSNGLAVIVNYGTQAAAVDGVQIEPLGYAVVGG
ncbi:DUF5696 domain-containing protein [Paenibacillus solisilvae]|uniref:DUF5696 domain-containing protein n=1 Tax=Paenibacillus solisilvae TaxID=2486751 RepID=A0ABW0W326_9BACL